MLPHEYPFRLTERLDGDRVGVRVSSGAAWMRGAGPLPAVLAIEILAQAAILLLPSLSGAGKGLLAGVDHAEWLAPPTAGDSLEARIEVEGKFGALVKVRGKLIAASGETVASASLLLARA